MSLLETFSCCLRSSQSLDLVQIDTIDVSARGGHIQRGRNAVQTVQVNPIVLFRRCQCPTCHHIQAPASAPCPRCHLLHGRPSNVCLRLPVTSCERLPTPQEPEVSVTTGRYYCKRRIHNAKQERRDNQIPRRSPVVATLQHILRSCTWRRYGGITVYAHVISAITWPWCKVERTTIDNRYTLLPCVSAFVSALRWA